MKFIVLFCILPLSSAVTHSLRYFYTATSGIPDFPEFVMVGMVDGVDISYYDSFIKKSTPRQTWMEDQLDQEYWKSETGVAMMYEINFRADIGILQQRFNQTGGVHVLQKMYGCQWDDTGGTRGMDEFGYDGKDFLSFDLKNMRWVAAVPQAAASKEKWDRTEQFVERKAYFHDICVDWLKKYLHYGSSSLEKQVGPKVSLLQKDTVSSQVVCHATGFYPEEVMITWKKDGKELTMDNVDIGETLPNEDGTFQKRAVLEVSPEERKTGQYTCEVVHTSGKPVLLTLTEKEGNTLVIAIIISCVVAFLAVVLAGVAIIIVKRKGYKKAEQSESDPDTSIPQKSLKRM